MILSINEPSTFLDGDSSTFLFDLGFLEDD